MTNQHWKDCRNTWALFCLSLLTVTGSVWRTWAAEESISFAGTYRDERISVELDRADRSGARTTYTGRILLGDQKFPLKAEAEEGHLKGNFESDGDEFEFAASLVGRMLVFTTDGTTYRLKKQTTNPLARAPSRPNPLAQPARTNAVPPSHGSSGVTSLAAGSSASTFRFRRYGLMDNTNVIGGEAFHFLIPSDWQVEGGLGWRMHPSLPAYLAVRVSNSNRSESLETFPTIPFVWAEGGIPLFPVGSNYMGNEVAEPIEDPVVFVQQVILPRFRPLLRTPQIVATEELPRIADAIAETVQEPGLQKKFRGARVRIEYAERGKAVQEDIYCILALTHAPALRVTYWGPDRNYSFKAEKGKLDMRTKVFQTIISSFQPSLEWFNRYVQLVPILIQSQIDPSHPISELGRFASRTSPEISELRRQLFERQRLAQERINSSFSQYIRGLQDHRNPYDDHLVQLPSGYQEVWANALGDYLLSDDVAFNPNPPGPGKEWQRVQKDR